MSSFVLDISGGDIAQLGDADLRDLIGLLCEADYRLAGLTTNGIVWGGHQDAKDGGLDVVVRSDMDPPTASFVPRAITGFQVKKSDMPRSEILKEMRPNGVLREEIKNLIAASGSYIIVSSSGSTTKPALDDRIDAMKEAVSDEDNNENVHLDFLDRGRIASWVRLHPLYVLWVRNKTNRPMEGWRSYENWAKAPGGVNEEYLLDDRLRLHDGTRTVAEGMSIEKGMSRLRAALSTPGASVRLTGLSGVGKTRFVQALFDERVGDNALNKDRAFYADLGDGPEPDQKVLARQLIAARARAVLIVDNCPPALHRRLTEIVSSACSTVSLLSVEYDVREDLPEETSVYRLEPASAKLIEQLIRKRFPFISQVDAGTISEFAGGNARMAIALASTVQKGETLSNFQDEELFERLFRQRHDSDEDLLVSAEACGLVYSFEGTDIASDESELNVLASLVNKTGERVYRDVAKLRERGLVQSRGVWRAVLPHAIANRLAKRALETVPKEKIVHTFLRDGSERLIKSFTRRLGYLHDCDAAVETVREWLAADGWIGSEIRNLNTFGIEVFKNIAPVSPNEALEAIERAAAGQEGEEFAARSHRNSAEIVHLLRQLAYDPVLFERSVKLICRYAVSEREDGNYDSTQDILKSLFSLYLSGTHAPVDLRAKIVNELLTSSDEAEKELGFVLLDTSLEAWHFSSGQEFDFGARSRDFGYQPQSRSDVIHWYETFIEICTRIALTKSADAARARKVLADNLRGLWSSAGMYDQVEQAAIQIQEYKAWNEGWIAVRGIVRFDSEQFDKEVSDRLQALDQLLRPSELLEQVRAFVLSDQYGAFDLEADFDDDEEDWTRADRTTRELGTKLATDTETRARIKYELLSTEHARLYHLGMGLAEGSDDVRQLWSELYGEVGMIPSEERQIRLLLGFLGACGEVAPDFYHETLDELVDDRVLGEWFPVFQTTSKIDERGVSRLRHALDEGKAHIDTYRFLAFGRVHESICDDDLAELLEKMTSYTGGTEVVLQILRMRFHGKEGEAVYSDQLTKVTQGLLITYPFADKRFGHSGKDHELAGIASVCLRGEEGRDVALELCETLTKLLRKNQLYVFDYPELLNSVAAKQPGVFLDVFLGGAELQEYHRRRMFFSDFNTRKNPLSKIADNDIVNWCDVNPEQRYPMMASVIEAFAKDGNDRWKPIVQKMLERAPNVQKVMEALADGMRPISWSGSRAKILEKRAQLFLSLTDHENSEVRAFAEKQYAKLQEEAKLERENETRREGPEFESFE